MKGGGTSSTPDEPILVRYQAAPILPTPDIRQISRKKIVTRFHLIRCSSSLLPNGPELSCGADNFPYVLSEHRFRIGGAMINSFSLAWRETTSA